MARVVLFGATGYTGKLTAHVLHERGADFAIVGRDQAKLEALAAQTGNPDTYVASVDDVDALTAALDGASVLITCVGPFALMGQTALDAALKAGVHYVDSTGEGTFVERMIAERDAAAKKRGIVMAPALGFDEIPGDVAVALATAHMERPEVDLTYAVDMAASGGTIKSILGIVAAGGTRIINGRPEKIAMAAKSRWSPMPPPLGPRRAISAPLSIGFLAPLHVDLERFETYFTTSRVQKAAMKVGLPGLRFGMKVPGLPAAANKLISFLPEGPEGTKRDGRFTILAEAHDGKTWRNVTVTGQDAYGLTANTLARSAMTLAERGDGPTGVLPPVTAIGLEVLEKELLDQGVEIKTYDPHDDPNDAKGD